MAMNQQEMEAKAKEIFSDEEYVKELLKLETAEEVQASLKEKGLELSIDEIMQMKDLLVKLENGELSEEDLEAMRVKSEDVELSEEQLDSVQGGFVAGVGAAVTVATWKLVTIIAVSLGGSAACLALECTNTNW